MNRYIDADNLKDYFFCLGAKTVYGDLCRLIQERIDLTPTADVVEVVRCRDCKYWQDNNGGYPHEECRWGKGETPDADDFCSYGERRTEE